MTFELLLFITFSLRIFGSYLDGRIGRGSMSWWSFHLLNYFRRDIPIIVLYVFNLGWPWQDLSALWLYLAGSHFFVHYAFYFIGEYQSLKADPTTDVSHFSHTSLYIFNYLRKE